MFLCSTKGGLPVIWEEGVLLLDGLGPATGWRTMVSKVGDISRPEELKRPLEWLKSDVSGDERIQAGLPYLSASVLRGAKENKMGFLVGLGVVISCFQRPRCLVFCDKHDGTSTKNDAVCRLIIKRSAKKPTNLTFSASRPISERIPGNEPPLRILKARIIIILSHYS
jgi:hypothetical protein